MSFILYHITDLLFDTLNIKHKDSKISKISKNVSLLQFVPSWSWVNSKLLALFIALDLKIRSVPVTSGIVFDLIWIFF